jgi:hypothetical protein
MRTGGDEIGAVVIGADEAAVKAALTKAEAGIRRYAKDNGLDGVPHPKRPGEKGVGMHLGYAEILPGRTLDSIFTEADLGVDRSKHSGAGH